MSLQISVFPILSSAKTLSRYLNCCTYLILVSPICNLYGGLFLLLTIMHSIFLQLMFSPFYSFSFTNFCRSSCSFLFVSSINTVSFAYFMSLRLWLPKMNPGRTSTSLRITSLYRLNKSNEKTHPCLTPFSIFMYY